MNENHEIRIPLPYFLAVVGLLLIALGWSGSPRDERGRPLLLMPDVKAVEDYRQMSLGVMGEMKLADGEIATVLAGDPTDLFGQTRSAQDAFAHALKIGEEIDRTDAPPAVVGLKEQLSQAANAYLEAARLSLRWVSVPEEGNRNQASQKLTAARAVLEDLGKSLWLQKK